MCGRESAGVRHLDERQRSARGRRGRPCVLASSARCSRSCTSSVTRAVGLARTRWASSTCRSAARPVGGAFALAASIMELSPTIPFRAGVGGYCADLRSDGSTARASHSSPQGSLGLESRFSAAITGVGMWMHSQLVIAVGGVGLLHAFYAARARPGRSVAAATAPRCLMSLRRPREVMNEWFALFSDVDGTLGREPRAGGERRPVPRRTSGHGSRCARCLARSRSPGGAGAPPPARRRREMRDVALDALRSAAQPGAVEPDLTIVAARALAERESPDAVSSTFRASFA